MFLIDDVHLSVCHSPEVHHTNDLLPKQFSANNH